MAQDFWNRKEPSMYGKLFTENKNYQAYADHEWNVPQHNDRQLFELFSLGVFAAGLNFNAAFSKRMAFRQAFHNWNPNAVANMDEKEIQQTIKNKAIIRNQPKIRATVHNAQIVCKIQHDYGSFDCYLWKFFNNHQKRIPIKTIGNSPVTLQQTNQLAKQMKKNGFKFVGPTSVCAFALSVGLIYVRPDQVGLEENPVHALNLKEQRKNGTGRFSI